MSFFFGPGLFLLSILPWVVLVALVVLVAFALRPKPDPRGRRPYAVYLFAVIFVTLFTAFTAVGLIGIAIADAATDTSTFGSTSCRSQFGLGGGPSPAARPAAGLEAQAVVQQQFTPPPPPRFTVSPVPRLTLPPIQRFTPPPFEEPPFEQPEERSSPRLVCESSENTSQLAIQASIFTLLASGLLALHGSMAAELIKKERTDA